MSNELSLDEILRTIDSDAEKLDVLCSQFLSLLTEEQVEEFSAFDSEHNFEESYVADDTLSSDEELFLSRGLKFIENKPPTVLSLTSSSSSSSSATARSYPSPASSLGSENDNSPSTLTAVSLAKVILNGTIPRLKGAITQYLENPCGAQPGIDEIREKFEAFQRVTSEAFRRFTFLRQNANDTIEHES